jgi:hypothetical protein
LGTSVWENTLEQLQMSPTLIGAPVVDAPLGEADVDGLEVAADGLEVFAVLPELAGLLLDEQAATAVASTNPAVNDIAFRVYFT